MRRVSKIVSRKTIGVAAVAAAAMFAIATPASAAPEVTSEQASVFTEMAAITDVPQDRATADSGAQTAKD
ncbi:MAG: hypothetical protein K0U64_06775, partial [Actinomycetia bacterium]|nr:hypothetical protein [Actinomycetes bacterium]